MATFPPTSALAVAATLFLACVSNPTPHPGGPDGYGPDTKVDEIATPAETDQRGVCDDLGGAWDDTGSACVDLDSGFEANAGAGDVPIGPPAADILGVAVSGEPHAYTFTVALQSDDLSCDRYADWWEVVRADGTLAYRDVRPGPQVGATTTTLSGGPVDLGADEFVLVRGHLHPDGYIGLTWVGSVTGGFTAARVSPNFADTLVTAEPQPPTCVP